MVAVVSGSGLGLFGSSLSILGGGGVFGNPQAGRNGERIYVNTATGNLVIQRQDEFLTAQGLDIVPLRTYNSLGVAANDGDNGTDNWRNGLVQKLTAETGTKNTAGATITKVFRDGREVVYTYNATRTRYESTEGDGAHDTLTWNGTVWTWTDGSARNTETYNGTTLRLESARDADGNLVTYTYTGSLLTSIADASGQTTTLTYWASTNDVKTIQVTSNGVTQTLTNYTYDASHRLQTVKVDLTPLDNSITDNNVYTTTYTYVSTSTRVSSITQSDGSAINFTYQTLNSKSRLKTIVVTNTDGGSRTTTFNYNTFVSAGGVYTTTDVVDPLGLTTTYTHSTAAGSSGRLLSVKSPTVGGVRLETTYQYDSEGNVTLITEDPSGLNRQTTFIYDTTNFTGNLLTTRDSLGNTVSRTYDANNQLLTETQYIVRDPDGSGSGVPSSPLTTRYAYDSESHLRFVISADGRVTEHRYNAAGQRILTLKFVAASYTAPGFTEANMQTWVNALATEKPERIDYAYDFRGNVTTMTAWNSTVAGSGGTFAGSGTPSITRFVYDQRGQLLNTIDPRGEATTGDANDFKTTYTYDSLGRLLTTVEWITSSNSRTTANGYNDGTRTDTVTDANGLITTRVYNQAGELISVAYGPGSLGTTTYKYDLDGQLRVVTDPTIVRQVFLYDTAGRKVASVDGDGSLTEYIYNRANQLIKAVRYARPTTSAVVDGSGNPTAVTLTTLRTEANTAPAENQISRNVYDASGALVYSIDESGAVTKFTYDGAGRLIDRLAYATRITVPAATDQLLPSDLTTPASPTFVATSVDDRRTRNFYDGDGNLRGTLDGLGYLAEYMYDQAGHLVQQVGYANQITVAATLDTGTLDDLRTAAGTDNEISTDPEKDITTNFYYDGQGRLIGTMDGERFWTEVAYTAAGQKSSVTRYDPALTSYTTSQTYSQVHTAVLALSGVKTHVTSYLYDGAGRVTQETNWEGTVTTYVYNQADNVTDTTVASGTSEARQRLFRYDFLGRVTQELSAEGAALLPSVLPADVETHWLRYGTKYTYDLAGRRVTAEARPYDAQNNIAQTNVTRYFYDNDGRLRFEVNQLGERKEYRYNALGQLEKELKYTTRLTSTQMSTLPNGGLLTTTVKTTLESSTNASDALTTYTYSLTGQVSSISIARNGTVGENALTTYTYNAFGQEKQRLQSIDATNTLQHDYTYDRVGQLKLTRWDQPLLNTTEARTYDAFGRLTSITDARLNVVKRYEYDRLGRETARTDAGTTDRTVTAWDAFDRKLQITDAMTGVTSFQYEPGQPAFKTKITTAAGITYVTHNRHGETVTVENRTAADVTINTTSYTYDKNGNLTGSSDTLGTLEGRVYDSGGRQTEQTDVRGVKTKLEYDAANRLFRKTVDSAAGGLALVTTYEFNGQGLMTRTTEPNGRITDYTYDRQGRVTLIAIDPSVLNLRTEYVYDRRGLVITMTEGFGVTGTTAAPRRTQYIYDKLGRRIEEIVDPTALGGTLNLRTQYKYDANGNLTRKIQGDGVTANQRSTWYIYDTDNRLTHTIDAMGGVTVQTYDLEDRVVATRRYATPIATGSLTDVVTSVTLTTNAQDRRSQSIFDSDGREIYTIDAVSDTEAVVTHRTFDALGNVTRQRMAVNKITWALSSAAAATTTALNTAMTNAGNSATLGTNDSVQWNAYDARSRFAYKMDSLGGVTKYVYDGDTVVQEKTFATPRSTSGANDLAGFTGWDTGTIASNVKNRVTRYWYDTLNRLRFTLVANDEANADKGYLTEQRYNDGARTETKIVYSNTPTVSGVVTVAQGASLATVAGIANGIAAANQQGTLTTRDVAGRIVSVRDALLRTEYFGYDAVGNRTSYTNRKGAGAGDVNYTWNYEYDAAGRLKKEIAPAVAVTSVTASGDTLTAATGSPVRIETVMTYDAFGNVKTRTEASNISGQSRTTDYDYDSLGRQILIRYPQVRIYDPVTGDTALSGSLTINGQTTDTRPVSTTTYDVFGNATRNVDVAGGTGYKVYDSLGRLRYEVDALKFVTEHEYDAFGNETKLTRYDSPSFVVPPYTNNRLAIATVTANVTTIKDANKDRQIVKAYDRVNRLTTVTQPSVFNYLTAENAATNSVGTPLTVGAQTVSEYNAFGQVVRMRQLVATGTYADNYFYYDKRGLKIAQVDAMKYLTVFEYDETGDLTRQIEYSRPLTGAVSVTSYTGLQTTVPGTTTGKEQGYDREVKFEYDQLNRKTKETRVALEHTTTTGTATNTQYADQVTTFGYDALGNQTRLTAGAVNTYTYYDVLGRVTAIAEPTRDRGDSINVTPLTLMFRDALGNLVKQTMVAAGATTATETTFPTYTADANNDRSTVRLVNTHGQVIQSYQVLSNGAPVAAADSTARYALYNARGQVAKEWQKVTNGIDELLITFYRYDALGRQTAVIEPQKMLLGTVIVRKYSAYNAFGEIISKQVDTHTAVNGAGTAMPGIEKFDYDQAGRLWRTNSGDGAYKVYLYDLFGNATAEIRARFKTANTTDLGATSVTPTSANNLTGTDAIRKETVYDLLGRVKEQREVTSVAANPQETITAPVTVDTFSSNAYLHLQMPGDPTLTARFYINGVERAVVDVPTGSESGYNKGVNLTALGLASGTYSYRVTFTRPTDSIPIAAQEGSFSYTVTATASVALTSTSVVGTVSGVTAQFSGGNTIIRWTASSGSVNSAQLEVRSGGGAWTTYSATFSTNWGVTFPQLSPGSYEYRITNFIGGITHSIGRGTLSVTAPSSSTTTNSITPDPGYVAIGTVTASATAQAQASGTKVSSSTAIWIPIFDEGGTQIGQDAQWDGTNVANLSWADVGFQAITVRLYYRTVTGLDTWREQSLAAGSGSSGMTFSWTDTLPPGAQSHGHGGFQQINAIEVRNSGGTVIRSSSVTVSNTQFVWTAPTDTSYTAKFSYKVAGTSTWTTLDAVRNGSQFVVSAPGLVAGTYDFQMLQYIPSGESALNASDKTGQFTVSGASASVISQVGDPPWITGVTASGSQFSWAFATGGATVNVTLRNASNVVIATLTPSTSNNVNFTASYNAVASGTYRYVIEYKVGSTVTAQGLGSITITTTPIASTITPTAPTNVTSITGFQDLGSGLFGWTTAPTTPASDVLRFRYKPAGAGAWTNTLTPTLVGGFYRVSLVGLATGSYDFEVSYTTSTDTAPYRVGGGRVSVTGFNTYAGTVTATALPTLVTNTPRQKQDLDRWGNAISVSLIFQERQPDGSIATQTNTSKYRYNQRGQLVETTLPKTATLQVNRTDGAATEYTAATAPDAISYNYYDVLGRLIGKRDANGNLSQLRYNAAGQVTREIDADNTDPDNVLTARKFHVYNAFNELIQTSDQVGGESGYRVRNLYDRGGRLVRTAAEEVMGAFGATAATVVPAFTGADNNIVVKDYTYDQAGRRLSETNGEVQNDNVTPETRRYAYDLLGNVIAYNGNLGGTFASLTYDALGRKTSQTDANTASATWVYDYFGHLTAHTDFGGTAYTYNYDVDRSWLLKSQASSGGQTGGTGGQNKAYEYDDANRLTKITDTGHDAVDTSRDVNRITQYIYDSAGRRAHERTIINNTVHQDTRTRYDAAGRISQVSGRGFSVTYSYDLTGNRTRIDGRYANNNTVGTQTLYYNYDQMNRVTVSQGDLQAGSVILGTNGTLISYDTRGMRSTATTGAKLETYTYDGLGRLRTTNQQDISYDESGNPIFSAPYVTLDRNYDRASRVTSQLTYAFDSGAAGYVTRQTTSTYNDGGLLLTQTTQKKGTDNVFRNESVLTFGAENGYDAVGNVKDYTTSNYQSNGTFWYSSHHMYQYVVGEGYQEREHFVDNSAVFADGTTTNKYNVNGELSQFTDQNDQTRNRYFANNAQGQALTFIRGNYGTAPQAAFDLAVGGAGFFSTTNAGYNFFSSEGQQVGTFGNFTGSGLKANFDVNFTPISPSYPASAPANYVAQAGDTLRSIAAKLFGDGNLWYLIAQANGMSDPDAIVPDGRTLEIPNQVISLANNATTFKPFDPKEAIGDTTPTQPYIPPPSKKGCGMMGMIIVACIALFCAIVTCGALAAPAGSSFATILSTGTAVMTGTAAGIGVGASIGIAAAGGVVGSIVSQGLMIAAGAQDGFDWKGVMLGAIGAGVTAGLGAVAAQGTSSLARAFASANQISYGAAGAALNSTLTQGISVLTGVQDHFSWRDVAISAISGPVAGTVGGLAGAALQRFGEGIAGFGASFAAGLAGSGVRAAFGGKIDVATAIADAFGNALGNSLVDWLAAPAPALGITPEQWADVDAQLTAAAMEMPLELTTQLAVDMDMMGITNNPSAFADPALSAIDGGEVPSAAFNVQTQADRDFAEQFITAHPIEQLTPDMFFDSPDWIPPSYGITADDFPPLTQQRMSELGVSPFVPEQGVWADTKELAGRFGSGVWGAVKGMVREPVMQVRDLGLAGASVFYNELIRDENESYWLPEMKSGVAHAYDNGASRTRLFLQSNFVSGIGVVSYDMTTAAMNGQWGDFAEMSGSLAGGFALGKVVGRYGDYRLQMPLEVTGNVPRMFGQSGATTFSFRSPLAPPKYNQYSVYFQGDVPANLIGESRSVHFREMNRQLLAQMDSDAQFARTIEKDMPNIRKEIAADPDGSPVSAVWHHATLQQSAPGGLIPSAMRPGVLQLVPRMQHTSGSLWWSALHPGNMGGYAEWAIPAGAPKNR